VTAPRHLLGENLCASCFGQLIDDQPDKDRSHGKAATSTSCIEGHAGAIIRCRRHYVETNADRLRTGFNRRPEPCLAALWAVADGITGDQTDNGIEVPMALANDILLIMQGMTPPADKSSHPRTARTRHIF
jgi:hypothetical protein